MVRVVVAEEVAALDWVLKAVAGVDVAVKLVNHRCHQKAGVEVKGFWERKGGGQEGEGKSCSVEVEVATKVSS